MLPHEIERLWSDYVAAEKVRLRGEYLAALERFVPALLELPVEVWHPWALELARRIVDEKDDPPVRFPLFRAVLFPPLLDGVKNARPGAARWLAGLHNLLYKSPECMALLPPNRRYYSGLLQQAVQDDPGDMRSKRDLLESMRDDFDYALHELPAGVLYGNDGASSEECLLLLDDLSAYEKLAQEMGPTEDDRELMASARFHITEYRRYLLERPRHRNYEAYLEANGHPPC